MRDDFDRRLAQRLRNYEARLPDAGAPDLTAVQRGRFAWPLALAGGVAAIAAGSVLAMVLSARITPPVGEASPQPPAASASASAQATPSSSASESGSPPAASPSPESGSSVRDTIWRIVVSDLVVRTEPGVADASTILPAPLTDDDRVLVVDGPRAADGYEWYQVLPIRPDGLHERPFGWVAAASRVGEPWLVIEDLSCPDSSELGGILRLAPEERLACYGGRTIQFRGGEGGCAAADGLPVSFEPRWLRSESGCGFGEPQPGDIWLGLRFPPGVSEEFGLSPSVEVIGHFDDPAAATCMGTANYPEVTAPTKAEAVALCRTEFVVESLTPVP